MPAGALPETEAAARRRRRQRKRAAMVAAAAATQVFDLAAEDEEAANEYFPELEEHAGTRAPLRARAARPW